MLTLPICLFCNCSTSPARADRGLIHHFSLTSINISLAETKHSLQMAAEQSALLQPAKLSLHHCGRVHVSKLSTLPIKHWRDTIFKHLFYILPLTGQVHWQANFILKICSVKSERNRSKRSALSTGCNQLRDTNSFVVSGFPPSARLSYHSRADFAPGQQEVNQLLLCSSYGYNLFCSGLSCRKATMC